MKSCSILSLSSKICPENCDPSLDINPAAATGTLTPHALPRTALEGTKQYCIFLSSQRDVNVMITSMG